MNYTISDVIENFLLKSFGDDELLSICRNDLANHFSCAPSQINYVLSTRFTIDRGFVVQSKRGGGGYISIFKRSECPEKELLMELISDSEGGLSYIKACHMIDRLHESGVISLRESGIIKASVSNKALNVGHEQRATLRANIFEKIITELLRKQ